MCISTICICFWVKCLCMSFAHLLIGLSSCCWELKVLYVFQISSFGRDGVCKYFVSCYSLCLYSFNREFCRAKPVNLRDSGTCFYIVFFVAFFWHSSSRRRARRRWIAADCRQKSRSLASAPAMPCGAMLWGACMVHVTTWGGPWKPRNSILPPVIPAWQEGGDILTAAKR